MIKLAGVSRRIILSISLGLCILFIVVYTSVYITKSRHKTEANYALIMDNHKILLENQKMLLSNFISKYDSIHVIYKIILLNDSIIFENMKKLDK